MCVYPTRRLDDGDGDGDRGSGTRRFDDGDGARLLDGSGGGGGA